MKKLIALLIITYCNASITFAQNAAIKGVITDTTNQKNLANTVITLLKSKDSILYKFTRSKEDGSFALKNIDTGNYEVLISHNAYADYVDHIKVSGNDAIDLGKVMMTLKANLLKDVTVRSQIAAIRMRGDTTEYTADSFQVRPGASVEELLKKMPGITIDKDGKITAQGTNVEKVLVDGEEFFGDDPTIATKNLQADAIDKVQVFDKKSDQAAFTGIDDGQSKKTINLKMKEDKKRGYFGKLDLGGGLNDRWNNSAMINRFRAKKKISAYGIMSSTGKTGLNWDERGSYGGGDGMPEYNDDFGGFVFFGDGDEFSNSNYYGEGLPKSWAGGINYSNKYDDDKQNINGSYRFNKLNTESAGKTLSIAALSQGNQVTNEEGNTFNSKLRHSANGTYEWNIDSSTSIKAVASGYTGKSNGFSSYNSIIRNQDDTVISKSRRNTSSDGDNQNLKASILLRKKFKKTGRTFSFNLDEQYNASNIKSYLFADITTYDANRNPIDSITDQQKLADTKSSIFSAKAIYTEPLSKKVFLEINYAIRSSKSTSERFSYDKNSDGKYDQLNELFSNKYKFDVLTNTTGLALKFNGKKITASAGSDIAFQDFKQQDLLQDTLFTRNYTNFFPRANFRYKLGSNSNLSIGYNGSTHQPSITQIQPIKDNSNPLVVYEGNPDLKQEFRHNIYLNFNSWKVLSQRGFYMYANYSANNNAIVTSQFTDYNTGKTTYRYVNSDGNYNIYSGGDYSMKLKKLDMYVNLGFNFSASKYSNYINDKANVLQRNVTNNTSPGIRWGTGKYKEKKYNLYYNGEFRFNYSKSSINTSFNNNYWSMSHSLNANVQLPWKMEINTDVDYNLRQKTKIFTANNNVFLWNGYVGRKILKNDKGLIKLSAYDILNQNKGYSRNLNTNISTEQTYQTLTRYFLLSFVWNFSKSPAGVTPNP